MPQPEEEAAAGAEASTRQPRAGRAGCPSAHGRATPRVGRAANAPEAARRAARRSAPVMLVITLALCPMLASTISVQHHLASRVVVPGARGESCVTSRGPAEISNRGGSGGRSPRASSGELVTRQLRVGSGVMPPLQTSRRGLDTAASLASRAPFSKPRAPRRLRARASTPRLSASSPSTRKTTRGDVSARSDCGGTSPMWGGPRDARARDADPRVREGSHSRSARGGARRAAPAEDPWEEVRGPRVRRTGGTCRPTRPRRWALPSPNPGRLRRRACTRAPTPSRDRVEEVVSSGVSGAWWRRGWRSGPAAPSRTAPSAPCSAEADITGEEVGEAPRRPPSSPAAPPADAGGGSFWETRWTTSTTTAEGVVSSTGSTSTASERGAGGDEDACCAWYIRHVS